LLDSIRCFADNSEFEHFRSYDFNNPGLSRFVKVDYFCNKIVQNRSVDQLEILKIFSQKSLDARIKSKITPSIFKLYEKYHSKTWVILTNCDESQIFEVLEYFRIDRLFAPNIYGTPPSKKIQAKNIVQKFDSKNMIFLSDAEADGIIAKDNRIDFLFVREFSRGNKNWTLQNYSSIQSLFDLI
jgi:phosphoglycolate phosphatase-like HAD superfamily hydrolase